MGGTRRVRAVAGLGLVAMLWACAGGLVRAGDRLGHPSRGGSIADLERWDGAYSRVEVGGATLAYRGPGPTLLAWVRECRGEGNPRRLAQALLFDWKADAVSQEATRVHDAPGWILHARSGAVELRAVTRAGPACSDDWILVTRGAAGDREALLDRWIASFDPGAEGPRDE